jgi:hypothetical protein
VGAVVAWAAGAQMRHIVGGVLAGVVLVLLATVAVVGVEIAQDDGEPESPSGVALRAVDERVEARTDDNRFADPLRPIVGLTDGDVRLVEVTGLDGGTAVRVRQCTADETRCAPAVPVQADDDGRARFLFEFTVGGRGDGGAADLPSDCTRTPCALVVTGEDGERLTTAGLQFGEGGPGAEATDGALRVDRRTRVRPGESLAVTLTGFAPGTVTVTLCTPPGPVDARRCGAPAPEVVATVDAAGTAAVELPVYVGDVGEHGARCGRGDRCAVAVAGRTDVAVVPLSFAGSTDARPGALQVAIGLTIAAVLGLAAYLAARRGPWTPPDGDPFAGIVIEDPFAGIDLDDDDQPATSRRAKDTVAAATSAPT